MSFLLTQMIGLLAAALIIGLLGGYLMGRTSRASSGSHRQAELLRQLDSQRGRTRELAEQNVELSASVKRLRNDKSGLERQLTLLGTRMREQEADQTSDRVDA